MSHPYPQIPRTGLLETGVKLPLRPFIYTTGDGRTYTTNHEGKGLYLLDPERQLWDVLTYAPRFERVKQLERYVEKHCIRILPP